MHTVQVEAKQYHLHEIPQECPRCHHAIDPRIQGGAQVSFIPNKHASIEVHFQCPRLQCRRAFLGLYKGEYLSNHWSMNLQSTSPNSPKPPVLSDEVRAVSPMFVKVSSQAASAEAWELDQIAGVGYRKAIEFLIKDYAISLDKPKADEIRRKFLGNVIAENLPNPDIQSCAQLATWLGNDETHYVRLWTEMDITDLKNLIALTESWITSAERTRKYLSKMKPAPAAVAPSAAPPAPSEPG